MTSPIRTNWQPFYMNTPTEPPQQTNSNTTLQGAQTFTQDDLNAAIEKGRKEAHDRLYGRIEELSTSFKTSQEQLAQFQAERETEAEQKAREEAERAAVAKAKEEAELDLRALIERREAETKAKFEEYESRFVTQNNELAARDALLAKEREYAELTQYRLTRLAEVREPDLENGHFGIVPNLIDFADARNAWGNTKEEVDNTLALMQSETRSILEGMQRTEVAQRASVPGVAPTAGNTGALEAQQSTRTYSAEDINAMPVNSPEYQALRQQYGMGRAHQQRGIFG
jgi:hypothetical protein